MSHIPNEPSLYTRGGNYYLVFYDPEKRPKQKWVPLKTKQKRTAQKRAAPLERQYMAGAFDPWADDAHEDIPEVQRAVQTFLAARKDELTDRTWQTYKYDLEPLAERFRGMRLDHVPPAEVDALCRRGDISTRTIEKRLTEVKTLFNFFVQRGVLGESPVEQLEPPRPDQEPPRYLSQDDVSTLLDTIRTYAEGFEGGGGVTKQGGHQQAPRWWLLHAVRLGVSTGMRRGGLVRLTFDDLGPDHIHVPAASTKRDGYTIPLFEDAQAVLEDVPHDDGLVLRRHDGSAVPETILSKQFARFRERAGVPEDVTFHTLRHTFASWLVQAGVPLYKVSRWLGHHSITVTERYAHLAPHQSDERAEALFS
jgi:integrase